MPCGCNGAQPTKAEQMYEVTLPSGERRTLNDHDAKVAITMAGGGVKRPIRT